MGSRWKIASVFGIVVGVVIGVIGAILATIPGGGSTLFTDGVAFSQTEHFTVYPYQGVGTVVVIIGVLVIITGFVVLVKLLEKKV
jgi:hypothetical protein